MSPRAERHPSASEGDSSEPQKQPVLAVAAKPARIRVIAFDPAKHCGSPTHPLNGGTPCRRQKGWGTAHRGSGQCRLHFGNSANGKMHAATEAATAVLRSLGIPVETDPQRALLEQVWEAAGNVAFLRQRVSAMGDDLTLHSEDTFAHRGEDSVTVTTIREDVKALVKLYNEERDRLAKISKLAIDAGIAARFVAIAESQAEAIVSVINAVLDGLGLDDVQRERGREIAGTKLRLLSGGVAA